MHKVRYPASYKEIFISPSGQDAINYRLWLAKKLVNIVSCSSTSSHYPIDNP